ncbi:MULTISPECIES: LytTR family DNA-binding domain-containing protein [unclassified Flavobacterium]|uniref:LytR/AlgR family response regulator transcription factor n=1 Tax=unclassified Flavobacterium TaxID=196869 RepID=UPI001F12A411|nr:MULTISPECIES: LytTR family DNA-binding domain-containing protein [unclassified Flavobacterium]UMY64760.1 LytTR family DNA-binding domain-containing protein [Flavobacterium sp. HJ-32-4]
MKPTRITAGIIDDESHGREYVRLLLSKYFPDIETVFSVGNPYAALAELEKGEPDILFLDVQLGPDTVFTFLERAGSVRSSLIFVTAHENFAIKAIRHRAVDYLLKPVDKDDFVAAVRRALRDIEQRPVVAPRIKLPVNKGFRQVDVATIVRCEADSNYTHVFLTEGQRVLVAKTLQEFEEQLTRYGFFRVHHKHLVNLRHVEEYQSGKGGKVLLTDESVVDVSQRRKSAFLEKLASTTRY